MMQVTVDLVQNAVNLFFSCPLEESLDFSASMVVRSQVEHSTLDQIERDHVTEQFSFVQSSRRVDFSVRRELG